MNPNDLSFGVVPDKANAAMHIYDILGASASAVGFGSGISTGT